MAGKWPNMAEIAIAIISLMLLSFGAHGFDIMSEFRNTLLGVNVLLRDDGKCLEGLIGVSSAIKSALPNSAMTASTFHADHEPYWGRLLSRKWWMPSVHDKFQYLKIDLLSLTVVRKSAVQGSGDSSTAGARVITYFLYHSKDDTIWYPVLEKENPRMFVGNLNNSEVISKSSFTPFMTRHVKFCPHSWIHQIALRVELYGCKAEGLDNPLGMEVKTISDGQISATSMESETYRASNARLHLDIGGGGWCADSSLLAEQPQYLQVYFQSSVALTAVATQGIKSDSSCVTQYYLSTTFDFINWVYIHDLTGRKVFKGCNQDAPLDVVLNHLPISTWGTRGVRFYVHTWHRRSCLRVEVYGYDPFRAGNILNHEDQHLCSGEGLVIGSYASPHIRTCWCRRGYEGDGFFCEDVDECSVGDNVCGSPDRLCKNVPGSFVCECQQGTTRDGNQCKDIDECANPRDVCPYLTECINTVGSYICDCKEAGFKADGKQCLDIDECKIGSHNCEENSTCVNAFGSYACFCNVGFTESYSLEGKLQCVDVDECQRKTKRCGSNGKCVNTIGSYFCLCKHGYAAKGLKCQDLDECATDPEACEQDSLCVNLPGSYACQCKLGYHLTDNSCHDVNECQQNFAECHHWADCYNTDGSYLCVCKKGFYGDGFYCSRKEQCSKEDEECNAALKRQEKRTGVKTAALKMSSGQDELKQRRLFKALLVMVVIKLLC
ncbi:unnamed protein product [Porites lobata]|uniref:Uncharacterized protein n=1 Tax=Porites lobata TaxID=104759 RepID=A0ABN8N066_9CNID|nr:unnamed protein product [Porites lobata]